METGQTKHSSTSSGLIVAMIAAMIVVVGIISFAIVNSLRPQPAALPPGAVTADSVLARATRRLPAPNWEYTTKEDEMMSKPTKFAHAVSKNSFVLSSPYGGVQNGTLWIRNSPRFGQDVYVAIERGQIILPHNSERIRVRFDNNDPVWYEASHPTDHSSTIVFLQGYNSFVKRLAKSVRIRIELNLYEHGTEVLDFNTEGFDPSKL
jgi:hypothetical protein